MENVKLIYLALISATAPLGKVPLTTEMFTAPRSNT